MSNFMINVYKGYCNLCIKYSVSIWFQTKSFNISGHLRSHKKSLEI